MGELTLYNYILLLRRGWKVIFYFDLFILLFIKIYTAYISIYYFYRVDIEAQMTMFAYYYACIGLEYLIVSYFQVSGFNFILKVLSFH